MKTKNYIIATIKPWNIKRFKTIKSKFEGNWFLISNQKKLTYSLVKKINPRYIFFPHWSFKIKKKIFDNYECVCFHETDLPYGRGGSPIQNLISRGYKTTFISALKMNEKYDSGPIYFKRKLSLKGKAELIYENSSKKIFDMIQAIYKKEPSPSPQKGRVVNFKRRKEHQSKFPKNVKKLEDIYDHIRMLDARTYPTSYLDHGNLRIYFKETKNKKKYILTKAYIINNDKKF